MLTLADASSYFDQTQVFDGYTGDLLFNGQIDPFDDSKRDSATAYRRVLSVAPGTTMPAAGVVSIFGARWIVGGGELDGLEEQHRQKFVLHPVKELYNHGTLAQYLEASVGQQLYGDLEWVKDSRESEVSSKPAPLYNLYLAKSAPVLDRQVLWAGGQALLTLAIRPQPSGVQAAMGELLEYPVETATVQSRTYSPASGGFTAGAAVTAPCLRVRWQALYEYDSQADAKYQEGDCNLVLPTSVPVSTSSTITLAGQSWAVLSTEVISGAQVVHARLR